jgi:hypothetical protein
MGVLGVLQLVPALPFWEQVLESGWSAAERSAETANKFRGEWLEDETIFLFDEGHLGPFSDGILAAKLGRNDEPAFGGDSGEFGFHAGSPGLLPSALGLADDARPAGEDGGG